ncbi:uncharacterized protein PV09_03991 [Verruconis gallopava]|uniref:glutathione transferase n=1 Tax=Verruconis gallopava TaxID=253628 RepID=A0A0D1XQC1_9PEZI|nr:uncharacterized protein PV09_03991 [Verruconis gallopava]KIW04806.1 hypothetical protein PV09_03991 [Verruconis gallopava]
MTDANKGCKITVHWLEQSRAQRIIWLFEELNLKYDIKLYKRGKDLLAPKELQEIHPLGKSPVINIETPSGASKVVAESGVIVDYICKHFGPQLIPKEYPAGKENEVGAETEAFSRYNYFLQYAEGSLMPPLLIYLVFSQLKGPQVPFLVRPITRTIASQVEKQFLNQEIEKQFRFIEAQLGSSGGDFICGSELTGADIMLIFPLQGAIEAKVLDKAKYPNISAYIDRLEAREAWKKAVRVVEEKTGEKYSVAP